MPGRFAFDVGSGTPAVPVASHVVGDDVGTPGRVGDTVGDGAPGRVGEFVEDGRAALDALQAALDANHGGERAKQKIAALKKQLAAQAERDRAIEARLSRLEGRSPAAVPVKAGSLNAVFTK